MLQQLATWDSGVPVLSADLHEPSCLAIGEPRVLVEAVTRHVARRGWAPAITAPSRSALSYWDLAELVRRTHQRLTELGCGRNQRIAQVLRNSPEAAGCAIALMQTATCVPLNPEYRQSESERYFRLLKAGSAVVIASGETPAARAAAAACGVRVIDLAPTTSIAGLFELWGVPQPVATPQAPVRADDIAMLLCTSGTTAGEKVVALTHGNLLAAARSIGTVLELTADECSLVVMPTFHIHGLSCGVCLTQPGSAAACTPPFESVAFFRWLDELRPTWYTVPRHPPGDLRRCRSCTERCRPLKTAFFAASHRQPCPPG